MAGLLRTMGCSIVDLFELFHVRGENNGIFVADCFTSDVVAQWCVVLLNAEVCKHVWCGVYG